MYEQLEKQKKNKRRVASTPILKKRQIEKNFISKRRVIQRASGIEVEGGSQVLDSPQAVFENLTEDEIMKQSSESLVTELTPILKNYVSIVNYNSLEDKVREILHQQTEEAQGRLELNSILTLKCNQDTQCAEINR